MHAEAAAVAGEGHRHLIAFLLDIILLKSLLFHALSLHIPSRALIVAALARMPCHALYGVRSFPSSSPPHT